MSGLSPIEQHIRAGDRLDSGGLLVVRGWPLTVDGMLRNADLTLRRYSRSGEPFVAISAEVTVEGWDLDSILAGPRLRTRRSYATATVGEILHAGYELVPTFVVPHYSVALPSYTEATIHRLLDILGDPRRTHITRGGTSHD